MRLVIISDTHGCHDQLVLPEGDVLIHAGDFCLYGDEGELRGFAGWIGSQNFEHKVCVAGNHDWYAQERPGDTMDIFTNEGVTYLEDDDVNIGGMSFYGSPWTPKFYNWAFMKEDYNLIRIFDNIPIGVDVLITHGPPKGVLDKNKQGTECGSQALLDQCTKSKPLVHAFGHIHESYGVHDAVITKFVNAAGCDLTCENIVNQPIVVDI